MNNNPAASGKGANGGLTPDGMPPHARNFAAVRKVLFILFAISILAPVICLGGYGYYDFQRRSADAIAESDRSVRVAEEHALKVMDLNAELVSRVEELLSDTSSAQVRDNEGPLHQKLTAIAGTFPQVAAISVFGDTGKLLVSSRFFPVPPVNVSKREDFMAARQSSREQYVSRPMTASISGARVFNVAKARTGSEGRFLGTVSVALRRDYFDSFYQKLIQDEDGTFIGLYRQDGTELASYPKEDAGGSDLVLALPAQAFALNETRGELRTNRFADKEQRVIVYQRIGAYRIFVAGGFLSDELLAGWLRHFLFLCALAAIPVSAILALLGFSVRQLSAEERAWNEWRNEFSRRLDAEASRRHLQRMSALGNLVANVAHEFNNYAMAVTTHMAIARSKGLRDVGDEVSAVERATRHVEALVRTLMGATRKQPSKLSVVDLGQALSELATLARTAVGDSIAVSVEVSPGLWPVRCDASELQMAIVNIALNARDAMPEGGALGWRAQNVNVTAAEAGGIDAGDYVLITASDTGAGMAPAVAERAFEPLFTTKHATTSVGLGLTQVQSFCELSGGVAKITSSPGAGAMVSLYLPRSLPMTPALPENACGATGPTDAADESVLLVEDNAEVAAGLVAALDLMGRNVTHLENADDALRMLQAGNRFKLVLSDVQMPGKLNGIDLVEWMKVNRPGQAVALMTGYADELERARRTGAPIFGKPFDIRELVPLLARTCAEGVSGAFDGDEHPGNNSAP